MTEKTSKLSISLFGTFRVVLNDEPINAFESQKGRALLAYLAVESDRAHNRTQLAALFWPDEDPATARRNLRQALYNLRQVLAPAGEQEQVLNVTRQEVQFNGGAQVDAGEFMALMDAARQHEHRRQDACPECMACFRRAHELYQGEFLVGFLLPDAYEFDGWARQRREQFRADALEALSQLAVYHERVHEYELAAGYYRRQIELDSLLEGAHQGLMRALALGGNQAAALRQYEILRGAMADLRNMSPSAETDLLYAQIRDDALRPQFVDSDNPYKGLYAFGVKDAADFFGRKAYVDQLEARVRAGRFVILVGASGSGKSSVIHAGLIPRLQNGASEDESWSVVSIRPGSDPFLALAEALAYGGRESAVALSRDVTALRAALLAVGEASGAGRVLLVVDQFEELYTLCPDPESQRQFIDFLLEAGEDGVTVLAGIRADFTGRTLSYRPLADRVQEGGLLLGPMNRQELRRAITLPARRRGMLFEPGLVSRLLGDVGEAPGNLPLLQFALTLLWENRGDGVLTHAAYERLGGVPGALASYADHIFAGLTPAQQERARRIFTRMVWPGVGAPDTRRSLIRHEIDAEDWRLVQALADRRLVVTNRHPGGEETAELAHEALIHHWQRLQEWLEADRRLRLWQMRLQAAVAQWRASDLDEGALLRGAPLAEAESWLAERAADLSEVEIGFIRAGVAQRQREEVQVEAQRQQALHQAEALAQAEHQRAETAARGRRRLAFLAAALAISLLIGITAALFAFQQWQIAREVAQRALPRQLGAEARSLLASDFDLALLLGLESQTLSDSPEDRSNLLLGIDYSPLISTILHGETAPLHDIAFSDGSIVGSAEGATRVWDVEQGRVQSTLLEIDRGSFARLSPDGRRAAVLDDATLILWDVQAREAIDPPLTEHDDRIDFLSFSDDGSRLVTGSVDGVLLLREAEGGAVLRQFDYDGSGGMALSPDGSLLAMFDDFEGGPGVEIWDMRTGERIAGPILEHEDSIHSIKYSHDGALLATTSFDGSVRLWDGRSAEPVGEPLIGHTARVLAAAFSPDGRILASGGTDNTVMLWDVESGEALGPPLAGHSNWVRALAFSEDGWMLASADAGGSIVLWDLSKRQILQGHEGRVRSVTVNPAGDRLVTGGFDPALHLWDAKTGAHLDTFPSLHETPIAVAAYSPDGRVLASGDFSGALILWDAETLHPLHSPLIADKTILISLAFSPDGAAVAAGHFSGGITVWDVASGQPLRETTAAHDGWALALAFSPDGKRLASGSTDADIKLWDAATLSIPAARPLAGVGEALRQHDNWVTALLFSDDNATLISGSGDHTIRFWDVASGQPLGAPLNGHETQVWDLEFSPLDGDSTLVSLGGDGSVIWWDVASREPLAPPLRTDKETEMMALNPDGSRLYLGTFDHTAQIWLLDQQSWPDRACRIANRDLTGAEIERYLGSAAPSARCGEN